jgi:hypothetical protein
VTTKTVKTNGDLSTNFSLNGATSGWDALSGSVSHYVYTASLSDLEDTYTIAAVNIPSNAIIESVRVQFLCVSLNSAYYTAIIKPSSTVRYGTEQPESANFRGTTWSTNPDTSEPWTVEAANAITAVGIRMRAVDANYAAKAEYLTVTVTYTTISLIPILSSQYRRRVA